MSVGQPQQMKLNEFGALVLDAFGHDNFCIQVGSSLHTKDWRDVDVRLMLRDEQYEALRLGPPEMRWVNARWASLCRAYSSLGAEMTGLPIDFQIQQMSQANKQYPCEGRCSLGQNMQADEI